MNKKAINKQTKKPEKKKKNLKQRQTNKLIKELQ